MTESQLEEAIVKVIQDQLSVRLDAGELYEGKKYIDVGIWLHTEKGEKLITSDRVVFN